MTYCTPPYYEVKDLTLVPMVPERVVRNFMQSSPSEVMLSFMELPDLIPEPTSWIGGGAFGVGMHDDQHYGDPYSVLLVAHGRPGWELGVASHKGVVTRFDARRGTLHLLNIHLPHALMHQAGNAGEPWVALTWDAATRKGALEIISQLKAGFEKSVSI